MPEKTPIKDLVRDALEHYDEASEAISHYKSVIPKALNFYKEYYDKLSQISRTMEGFLKGQKVKLKVYPEKPNPYHPTEPFEISQVTFTGGEVLIRGEDTIWFHMSNLELLTEDT